MRSGDVVLRFLQTVGRTEDAQFYLKIFRESPRARFAFVACESDLLQQAHGSICESMHFLAALGLYPVLGLGLDQPATLADAEELIERLKKQRVPVELHAASKQLGSAQIERDLNRRRMVVLHFDREAADAHHQQLAQLLSSLKTHKLVLLRADSGIGPKERGFLNLSPTHQLPTDENGINVINLRTDLASITAQGGLEPEELELLGRVRLLHTHAPSLLTSVTSPLNLLRELFTVRGAGTLIKTGSPVQRHDSYTSLDYPRLAQMLEQTFGRTLRPNFGSKAPLRVYLEASYRGAAIVHPGVHKAVYLTKFAVDRQAQGEGIGRDLWEALVRDYPVFYWRARTTNPISSWYATQCDGMHQFGTWRVYWRGIVPRDIPGTIRDALSRERDLIG